MITLKEETFEQQTSFKEPTLVLDIFHWITFLELVCLRLASDSFVYSISRQNSNFKTYILRNSNDI